MDIDGVLKVGPNALAGAKETLSWVRRSGLRYVLISNTTSTDSKSLTRQLAEMGLDVEPGHVITASAITADYIHATHPGARCFVLAEGNPFATDQGLYFDDDDVDIVIVGGAGRAFDYERLNTCYRHLLNGADFLAMHRNLSWRAPDGMAIDAGAFVAGLEAATGRKAHVLGKPSPSFFRLGLAAQNITPRAALMIGDDIENDVLAAQAIGVTGVLVRTGKFSSETLACAPTRPDHVIDSIADLPALVRKLGVGDHFSKQSSQL